ncbi:hypothetical protein BWR59_16915 [Pseudomonas sp. Bc-h]|uniref:hypothetical protein n=1 Tax=Pseudomonas sp. Bc-h TaxID=1943632 RepID=UPI0009D9F380|nr:hypothetical protein [Pseudomonas sp. Bc-h]OQR30242.1 hypothetical protein BWR59_16915 [Pseudomonas sp. Bc-h]
MVSRNDPAANVRNAGKHKPDQKSAIQWLNDYKELISLVAFFVGGLLWLYNVFATKHQIAELKCLMSANVDAIYSQLDQGALTKLLIENMQEQQKIKVKSSPNEEDQERLSMLTVAMGDIQVRLQNATAVRTESSKTLRSSKCSD